MTLNGATTYYIGSDGPTGLDYDLAKRFAHRLGVRLRVIVADRMDQVIATLKRGDADLAAAGLSATPQRRETLWFAPTIRSVTSQLVYLRGHEKPASLSSLDGTIAVVAGSAQAEHLQHLSTVNPAIKWMRVANMDNEELLYRVAKGKLAYTVAPSDTVAIDRRYYPDLKVAFDLDKPQQVAWALPQGDDDSLYDQTIAFFLRVKQDGELKRLMDRYFGFVDRLDYVGRKRFMRDAKQRLPDFKSAFEKASGKYHLDWRLLAALAYQESHWKPHAKSPTGVRGMMMLTRDTADYIGVDNRLNPSQSIMGGAQYLRNILDRLPPSIKPPDRIWMALAAYNIGLGHLMDARQLTLERGGDPDLWVDVRSNLPLLTKEKWYSHLHSGYARGRETIAYVGNIRNYNDILTFMTTSHPRPKPKPVSPKPPGELTAKATVSTTAKAAPDSTVKKTAGKAIDNTGAATPTKTD